YIKSEAANRLHQCTHYRAMDQMRHVSAHPDATSVRIATMFLPGFGRFRSAFVQEVAKHILKDGVISVVVDLYDAVETADNVERFLFSIGVYSLNCQFLSRLYVVIKSLKGEGLRAIQSQCISRFTGFILEWQYAHPHQVTSVYAFEAFG